MLFINPHSNQTVIQLAVSYRHILLYHSSFRRYNLLPCGMYSSITNDTVPTNYTDIDALLRVKYRLLNNK